MRIRKKYAAHFRAPLIVRAGLLNLFLALCLACIAGPDARQIDVDGQLPKSAKSILALRVQKIALAGISTDAALSKIADAVERSSEGNLHFSYGVGYAKSEVEEYVRKRIPEGKWKLRDPRIEIHATNSTLRDVIQKLCDQSGWSYKLTPIGVAFIDDRSYFIEKQSKSSRRQPE